MSWFMATLYDPFMARTEQACLGAWRAELLSSARGRVLEIGAGTGANIAHYPEDVELTLVEPDPHMRSRLEAALAEANREARIVEGTLSDVEDREQAYDTIVSTLVLCSVEDVDSVVGQIFKALKPDGRLLFLEHVGAAQDTSRRRWQERIEPVWKHLAEGCHLCRDTEAALERAGFEIVAITRESLRKALPFLRPSIRGEAIRP